MTILEAASAAAAAAAAAEIYLMSILYVMTSNLQYANLVVMATDCIL